MNYKGLGLEIYSPALSALDGFRKKKRSITVLGKL